MRCKLALLAIVAFGFWLNGCGSDLSDCPNPNTLSGFVYVQQNALDEPDKNLDDDIIVTDRPQPPEGFVPLKGQRSLLRKLAHLWSWVNGAHLFSTRCQQELTPSSSSLKISRQSGGKRVFALSQLRRLTTTVRLSTMTRCHLSVARQRRRNRHNKPILREVGTRVA